MTIDSARIREFWEWFEERSTRIGRLLDEGNASLLAKEVTPKIKTLHTDLTWEIGPGKSKEYSLTISAAKNRKLRPETSKIVSLAANNPHWEFYPARQAREVPPQVDLPNKQLTFRTENWRFHAMQDKEKRLINLFVIDHRLAEVDETDALSAVFLFLDAALGEDLVEEWVGNIEILDNAGDLAPLHPMLEIRSFLRGLDDIGAPR